VRHVFTDDGVVASERQAGGREVDGLIEAIDAERTQPGKMRKVPDDLLWSERQGKQ